MNKRNALSYQDEIFFYTGNENVAFIPSLFHNVKKTASIAKPVSDLKSYHGTTLVVADKEYTISNIELMLDEDREPEYYLIYIGNEESFKYTNKDFKKEKKFELELIEWLEANKDKEKK